MSDELNIFRPYAAVNDLPFVREFDDGRVSFWSAESTGIDNDTDICIGEYYARIAIAMAHRIDAPEIIALVFRDMVLGGKIGAIEAGFIGIVASAARAGSLN